MCLRYPYISSLYVVHIESTDSTIKKTQKKHRCSVQSFGGKLKEIAPAHTSGVRGGTCNEPVIRRAEVSTLPIQRVGLAPDVPCLQRTSWMQVWVGVIPSSNSRG